MAGRVDAQVAEVRDFAEHVMSEVSRVWVGNRQVLELALVALLARGHLLLEDVPGVGKTVLALSLSQALGCRFTRLQFTPDILPADVTGFTVYDQQAGTFRFRPGPVFTHVLLADEINRTVPRTQSSLLEAMQEGAVSVDGQTHPLPRPFWVLATQNPIDSEGTYPLPEAQRDRFLMKIPLGYPSVREEAEVLRRFGGAGGVKPGASDLDGTSTAEQTDVKKRVAALRAVAKPEEVLRLQGLTRRVYLSPPVEHYLLTLTRATREHESVVLGASPQASLALAWACQAKAAMAGRSFILPDDVKALAIPVLAHRLVLQPRASLRGVNPEDVIPQLLEELPVPMETDVREPGDHGSPSGSGWAGIWPRLSLDWAFSAGW